MTTLDNKMLLKYGTKMVPGTLSKTLIRDITPLLKLLYNNNLHTHGNVYNVYHTKYKLPKYKLYTNYYKSRKITNISTRVTCPAEEVSSNILPPWDVFHSKGVLLYRYGPPEH